MGHQVPVSQCVWSSILCEKSGRETLADFFSGWWSFGCVLLPFTHYNGVQSLLWLVILMLIFGQNVAIRSAAEVTCTKMNSFSNPPTGRRTSLLSLMLNMIITVLASSCLSPSFRLYKCCFLFQEDWYSSCSFPGTPQLDLMKAEQSRDLLEGKSLS